MARIINIYEAKTRLSELVEKAANGEEVIIARAGKPRARLVALVAAQQPRMPGCSKGKIWIADDFDDPLPPDILGRFAGELVEGEDADS
ncbi:MAG: type II toxin-antitoxin system Phd/YefM family antitoxin [Gemmatimonadaceae bacterium]